MAPGNIQSPQPTTREEQDRREARAAGAIVLWILAVSLMCNCVSTSVVIALLVRAK